MTDISAHTYGVWIVEEEDTQIASNTPGGITYTNLVLGDTYIYLDDIITFTHKFISQREGEDILGWKSIQTNSTGKIEGQTGGGLRSSFIITAMVDEATSEYLKRFFKLHVVAEDGNKYLVHQRATTTFEQFPNSAGVLKKYAEIIIRGIDIKETNDGGKDAKIATLVLEDCHDRN